jgi:phosphatidylglycerol:prolipoprotein diacylglycerol transferase
VVLRLGSTPITTTLPRAWARPTVALQVAAVRCDALVDAEPQALGVTYWFDAASHGEPYAVTVRFTGHRLGLRGKPGPRDSFTLLEAVEGVVPGSGRVAVSTRIFDIAPGEWHVAAGVFKPPNPATATPPTEELSPAAVSASGATGFAPVIRVRAPGARLGTWPGLVGAGVAVALIVQSRLAARGHMPVTVILLVSLLASVVGLLGARIYYLAEQRPGALIKPRALLTAGMCIQGFVLGAMATASIGMLLAGVSVGRYLDVTAPGLLFGMSIGRFGCFFGGCCAGRPTASRWGLWSSDRRLGMRRVPTQLLESALALALGVAALVAVLSTAAKPAGFVFAGAIAAYTLGRQLLFPWRDLPRKTSHGRTLTIAVTAAVLLAEALAAVLT